jgi:protein phosphatase 1 regulatory subunit 7
LYLAWNAIENLQGLPLPSSLNTVDLSKNKLSSLAGVELHQQLEELWLSYSLITAFADLVPLTGLPKLNCLYLEHSPIAKDFEYRKTITAMVPSLEQLDATMVNRTVR